MARKEPVFGE